MLLTSTTDWAALSYWIVPGHFHSHPSFNWSLNSFLALMPDNLRLYVTAHICKLSQWKQVQQMKICFLLGIARPASQQRHIWIATHYYTFSIPPPFFSIATGTAAPLLNYFIFKSCPCAGWNKINTSGGRHKLHISSLVWVPWGDILCSQWWHQHMCTKPTRLHAWAFRVGGGGI